MIKLAFAVFDSATQAYLPCFFCYTIEEAIRTFRHSCADPQTPFFQFPDDYTLFHIGQYDMKAGRLQGLDTPHSLGLALTFLPRESANAPSAE